MCNSTLALGRFLGKGSNKKVYVVTLEGQDVALMRGCSGVEVELMRKTRGCEHMVQLVQELGPHTVTAEVAEHGSLIDLQDTLDFEGQVVTSDHITVLIIQVQKALNVLWDLGFVHGDVAERNVLVFRYNANAEDTLVKLGDFGDAHASSDMEIDIKELIAMNLRLRKAWAEHRQSQDGMPVVN